MIGDYSTKTLREELARREPAAKKLPEPLSEHNIKPLKELVINYVKDRSGNNDFEDYEHYIYEAAVELIYGKDIWKYLNSL
jgi:hypothetical protein